VDDGGRESGSGMIDAALDLFNETPKSHLTAEQSTGHGMTVLLQYCSVVVYVESICWKGLDFSTFRVASRVPVSRRVVSGHRCRVDRRLSCLLLAVSSIPGSRVTYSGRDRIVAWVSTTFLYRFLAPQQQVQNGQWSTEQWSNRFSPLGFYFSIASI
jgi:hypothetical protein